MTNSEEVPPSLSVLLVEEDALIAEEIRGHLTHLSYRVVGVTHSAQQAIESARQGRPDVILMVVPSKSPMGGIEAALQIFSSLDIPVVYLFAPSDVATLVEAGVDGPFSYVLKPVAERELRVALAMAVQQHRKNQSVLTGSLTHDTILTGLTDAVIATDAEGRIRFMNPIAEMLTGWRSADARGRPLAEALSIVTEHPSLSADSLLARVIGERVAVRPTDIVLLTTREGCQLPIAYSIAPLLNRAGNVTGVVVTLQDASDRQRSEEALRESETFLQMSQQAGQCGSYEWDLTTSRVKWSDEMCRIHGVEPGEGNGRLEDSLHFIHPEDLPVLRDRMEYLVEHGESHPLNYRILRRDGTERRLWGRGVLVPDATGQARRIIGTVVDVTEHWNAEETLWRIMEALRPVTGPDFFRSLSAQLAQVCQTEYAFVGMVSPTDSQVIQSIAVSRRGELVDNFTYDLRGTPCENVVGNILCHYPTGVQRKFPADALLAEMGIDSYMGIPLFSRAGKALGLIVLLSDRPFAHTEQTETILRVVASRAGAELEREIAESALRESDEFNRQIIASTQAGLLVLDSNLRYRLWNPQMEATIGLPAEEVLGKSPLELFPSLRAAEAYRLLELALVGETTTSADFPFEVPTTGRKGWLWQIAGPLRNARNEIIGVLASVMDVTERHENQQQLQRQFERLEAQRVIDVSIIHNRDMLSTLRLVLENTLALLGADAAAILLPNRETESLEYAVFQGFPGGIIPPPPVEQKNEPATKAARERRRVTLQELPDGGIVFRRNLSEYGDTFTNYYAVPLIADDVVHGVLEVYTHTTSRPDSEWLESLDSLAAQAAIAAHHSTLLNDLERANEEMLVSHDATIAGWSRALDLRDKETEGHSERVTALTMRLAQAMGVEGDALVPVRRGALLHDVGKLGIPDNILLKTGPLTDDEWTLMRKHPTYAYEMLNPIAFLRPALAIPYCHHEKWDGTGYPNGLSGEQIPLPARIFALADVYDALCSNRPYRAGWPPARVREHIRNLSGTHLDPAVVEAFLRMEEVRE